MHEQSKAAERRAKDWHYPNLYFVGNGLDVGSGPDGLSRLRHAYPKIAELREWDLEDGDAQYLTGVEAESLDFLSASHVLEHMTHPWVAIVNWMHALKVGGYAIITVPDFEMYERRVWLSQHGVGHHWAFGIDIPHYERQQINILEMLRSISATAAVERITVLRQHFDPTLPTNVDQSLGPAECAVEIVLRRI
jgi:predicted SAM-dependent methyltransferase